MNRAAPLLLRKSIEIAHTYQLAGVLYVPMPCRDEAEWLQKMDEAQNRLGEMADEIENEI